MAQGPGAEAGTLDLTGCEETGPGVRSVERRRQARPDTLGSRSPLPGQRSA